MPELIAQTPPSLDVSRIVLAVVVLLAAVLLLAVALMKLRGRLLARDDSEAAPLTLHDLRRLHAEGSMTDEEFDRAKAALIGAAGAAPRRARPAQQPEPPTAPPSGYPSTAKPPEPGEKAAEGA